MHDSLPDLQGIEPDNFDKSQGTTTSKPRTRKASFTTTPHLLNCGTPAGGPPPAASAAAASPMAASEVVLDAGVIEATEGGGASIFCFSARYSSSLPFSTHILSCGGGCELLKRVGGVQDG